MAGWQPMPTPNSHGARAARGKRGGTACSVAGFASEWGRCTRHALPRRCHPGVQKLVSKSWYVRCTATITTGLLSPFENQNNVQAARDCTRRLSAIELGIRPGFCDCTRKYSTRWLRKPRIWHKISQIIRFRRSKPPPFRTLAEKAAPFYNRGHCGASLIPIPFF